MRTDSREMLALGMFGRGSRVGERIEMLLARGREISPRVSKGRVAMSGVALLVCGAAGALAPRVVAFGQELRFEVTSVRANKSGVQKWQFSPPTGDSYKATNVNVGMLLINAYQVLPFQIVGKPDWVDADRFDVEGKASGSQTPEHFRVMVQSLLEDRFKLAVHHETKELPVFELVVAKSGVKFKEAKCQGTPSRENPCGGFSVSLGGRVTGREVGVDQLGLNLSSLLSRTVIDKTGLKGRYNFDLSWTPDGTTLRGPGDPDAPPADPSGPTIFTAVQEQLGLELKSAKGPVEALVIDHLEKPDDN